MTKIDKLQLTNWAPKVERSDIRTVFSENDPFKSFITLGKYSLGWFVEQLFCNQKGKPLKLYPFQLVMLNTLWYKKFPMLIVSRGGSKSYMLGLYALLRAILVPGSKIVIAGAGMRQSKLVFRYIQAFYDQSPVIKEALKTWGGPKYGSDEATLKVGLSNISAIPIGDENKVRGMRANVLIIDEFAVVPEETFNIVLGPFTATQMDPMDKETIAQFVKRLNKLKVSQSLIDFIIHSQGFGNQLVIAGTAYYKQNHLYKTYLTYKAAIESAGDPKILRQKLQEISFKMTGMESKVSNEEVDRLSKHWKNYSVMKLPYQAIPESLLDQDMILSQKATFPAHRFKMEYEAEFPDDSDGFIKRSWIERATPRKPENPVNIELYGDPVGTYVLGLDPAKHNDNFGAVVLKLTSRGKELVYCDAWHRTDYGVSAQKIREICKRFPISYIAMDKGGGGSATIEWLCKKSKEATDNSELLWPIREQIENPVDLAAPGRKIIELVDFHPAWISEAAHGLENDIIHCNILFPYKGDDDEVIRQYCKHFNSYDKITENIKEAIKIDLWGIDDYDAEQLKTKPKLGIFNEINECTNETCAIVREVTPKGVESFVLPSISEQPEGLDMRRRDRFSALMLANYAAKVWLTKGRLPKMVNGMIPGASLTRSNVRRRGRVAF